MQTLPRTQFFPLPFEMPRIVLHRLCALIFPLKCPAVFCTGCARHTKASPGTKSNLYKLFFCYAFSLSIHGCRTRHRQGNFQTSHPRAKRMPPQHTTCVQVPLVCKCHSYVATRPTTTLNTKGRWLTLLVRVRARA